MIESSSGIPDPPVPLADTARQFGAHARGYAVSRFHAEGHTRLLLLEHLEPVADETLLDLGSGPGHTALAFAPYVRRVIVCDLAPEMLHAATLGARRRADTMEDGETLAPLERVVADAHGLPFRDRSLDLVAIRAAAHHFVDLDTALSETRRVLRRGGRTGIADPTVDDDDPELDAFVNALERLRDPTTVRVRAPREWRAALERAGLRVDFVEPATHELAEGRSLIEWIATSGGSSVVLAEAKRMLLTLPRRMKDALRVRTTGDDVVFDMPRVVITAKRID
ncbi:MAG: class I SAM-dependent methyltransferase [Candidatus Eisenbacteria bacterium]